MKNKNLIWLIMWKARSCLSEMENTTLCGAKVAGGDPNYSVAYAISDSPVGPFKRTGKILKQSPEVATDAGHHSVIHIPNTDNKRLLK